MIYETLWYTLQELNTEGHYEIVKVTIDDKKEQGTATIKNVESDNEDNWSWNPEHDIWERINEHK